MGWIASGHVLDESGVVWDSVLDFRLTHIFFFFLVRRNLANFASACFCKLFSAQRLVSGSEAKLSEFRLGGVTKSPRGEAKFVSATHSFLMKGIRCPKLPPPTFGQLMRFRHTMH
jgi:hypothetical protein